MNKSRFAKRMAAGAGLFFLCAVQAVTRAQSPPHAPVQAPGKTSIPFRPKKGAGPTDDLAGLNFTADQKAQINEIHKDVKSRMDTVVRDKNLSQQQKRAFLEGYRREENRRIFKVLTPEQQKEASKRIRARHAAEQDKKRQQPLPK